MELLGEFGLLFVGLLEVDVDVEAAVVVVAYGLGEGGVGLAFGGDWGVQERFAIGVSLAAARVSGCYLASWWSSVFGYVRRERLEVLVAFQG